MAERVANPIFNSVVGPPLLCGASQASRIFPGPAHPSVTGAGEGAGTPAPWSLCFLFFLSFPLSLFHAFPFCPSSAQELSSQKRWGRDGVSSEGLRAEFKELAPFCELSLDDKDSKPQL
jgi:hypothetical protein